MHVTFISQCEKKALNKTRRVLDAFANRIGSNTWQTVITNEGLNAVKKLLRKTATKNTAEARSLIFDYIEFYYNKLRRHGNNNWLAPIEYEKQYFEKLEKV